MPFLQRQKKTSTDSHKSWKSLFRTASDNSKSSGNNASDRLGHATKDDSSWSRPPSSQDQIPSARNEGVTTDDQPVSVSATQSQTATVLLKKDVESNDRTEPFGTVEPTSVDFVELPDQAQVVAPDKAQIVAPKPRYISLWDKAYDSLKSSAEGEALLDQYEKLLTTELVKARGEPDAESSSNDGGRKAAKSSILDPAQRQKQVANMLEHGASLYDTKGKIYIAGHTISIRDQLAVIADVAEFAKDWIDDAVKASPEASIAWSVVCLGLPLLTRLSHADAANADGLAYVTSRMNFYSALEKILFPAHQSSKSEEVNAELRSRLVELYKLVLEYQIKSIVRFHKYHWYKDIFTSNDWTAMQTTIKQLDEDLRQDAVLVSHAETQLKMKRLLENAAAAQSVLLDVNHKQLQILQDIQKDTMAQLDMQSNIHKTLQEMKTSDDSRVQRELSRKEQECLHSFRLHILYETSKDRVARHVPGTCSWFLQQSAYTHWLEGSARCLLVSADPGCGKSVLTKHLIEDILPKRRPDATILYFFFIDGIQDTLNAAICAILHQLFCANGELLKHAMPHFKNEGVNLMNNVELMLRILKDVLLDRERKEAKIIVFDALDECRTHDRERLLEWIKVIQIGADQGDKIPQFLMTSRPYDEILTSYEYDATSAQLHIPGNEEAEAISQEVKLVIDHRARELCIKRRYSSEVRNTLLKTLLAGKHHTYLWVHLVFEELEHRIGKQTTKEVQKLLDKLPDSVYEAYENILGRYTGNQEVHDKVFRILNIMLAVTQPLSLAEIQCAVKMELNPPTTRHEDLDLEDNHDFEIKLRNWCGLLIRVHGDEVHFLHQTVKDFLLRKSSNSLTARRQSGCLATEVSTYWGGFTTEQQANAIMLKVCVFYLLLSDFGEQKHHESKPIKIAASHANEVSIKAIPNEASSEKGKHHADADGNPDESWNTVTDVDAADQTGTDSEFDRRFAMKMRYPLQFHAARKWYDYLTRIDDLAEEDSIHGIRTLFNEGSHYETWVGPPGLRSSCHPYKLRPLGAAAALSTSMPLRLILQDRDLELDKEAGGLALLSAIRFGRKLNTHILLDHMADCTYWNGQEETLIHLSVQRDWGDVISRLVQRGVDLKAAAMFDELFDETALALAARLDMTEMISLLIGLGAEVDFKNRYGHTPLTSAALCGKKAAAETLLNHGADPSDALVAAAMCDDMDILLLLLAHGPNVNIQDFGGWTALHRAANDGNMEVLQALLAHGANVNVRDRRGYTAIHEAAENGHSSIVAELLKERGHDAIVQMLPQHGAVVDFQGERGMTGLMLAVIGGHHQVVQVLLDHHADASLQDSDCGTAETWAASMGHEDIAALLPRKPVYKRASMSELWPLKPFWDCADNDRKCGSTYYKEGRIRYLYVRTHEWLAPKRSLPELRNVVGDVSFDTYLAEYRNRLDNTDRT